MNDIVNGNSHINKDIIAMIKMNSFRIRWMSSNNAILEVRKCIPNEKVFILQLYNNINADFDIYYPDDEMNSLKVLENFDKYRKPA